MKYLPGKLVYFSRAYVANCVMRLFLQDDEELSEFALDGLKQVMAVKSRVVLPYLVPQVNVCLIEVFIW